MEILNQAMEFTQQYSLFFSGRHVCCDFDSCDLHDSHEQQDEGAASQHMMILCAAMMESHLRVS